VSALARRAGMLGLAVLVAASLGSCAVGFGYDSSASANYLGAYYEPYGYDYGGWQNGYRVGPPRGGEGRADHPAARPYRPAAPTHATPSIPKRPRRQ